MREGEKIVGVKWTYKTKVSEKGEINNFRDRLVDKGYTQKHIVDYSELFSPVARHDTIRMVISLAALNKCIIFQLDVKFVFLHGKLMAQVFVEQHPRYVKKGRKNMFNNLKRLFMD